MTVSTASAIYIAVKPLIKIYLNGALGYILAKKNVFDVVTCQRISTLIINFLVPALIFSNVIQSLYGGLIKEIGILVLTAFMFQAIGLAAGALIWYLTPNPRNWLGGVLLAAAFNNCSDLPIAYVTTLARGPYLPASAGHQGTAYSVIFMTVFIFSLFNLGGVRLLERDFKYKRDDVHRHDPSEPILARLLIKAWKRMFRKKKVSSGTNDRASETHQTDSANNTTQSDNTPDTGNSTESSTILNRTASLDRASNGISSSRIYSLHGTHNGDLSKTNSASDTGSSRLDPVQSMPAAVHVPETLTRTRTHLSTYGHEMAVAPGMASKGLYRAKSAPSQYLDDIVENYQDTGYTTPEDFVRTLTSLGSSSTITAEIMSTPNVQKEHKRAATVGNDLKIWFFQFCKDLLRPQSIALGVSLTITMIPWVRRLFYLDPDTNKTYGIPQAPDGLPILDFAIDFTSFIGNACVPLGLAMLGATIARINIHSLPRDFWQSSLLMCLLKLVILPIIALLWVTKLQNIHWLDPQKDSMASFVIIVTSGVPTATSQLYITAMLTASYSKQSANQDDEKANAAGSHVEMDCLAAYLLMQYVFLILSMTILVTYTLKNVVPL